MAAPQKRCASFWDPHAHHACRHRSPDHNLYLDVKGRRGGQRATLTVARKIARRAYHILNELEQAA